MKTHIAALNDEQKKRVRVVRKNVMSVTKPVDVIGACNFSFNIFRERSQLVKYFSQARKSLVKGGALILEAAGGPGMIEETEEKRMVGRGKDKFRYIWDQDSFDPITRRALYYIHFEFPNGKKLKKAFVYDWRMWTIPELRDVMSDAGFSKSVVYWEKQNRKGEWIDKYELREEAENDYAWITYIAGIR